MAVFRELGKRVIIIIVPSTCFVCSHLTISSAQPSGGRCFLFALLGEGMVVLSLIGSSVMSR